MPNLIQPVRSMAGRGAAYTTAMTTLPVGTLDVDMDHSTDSTTIEFIRLRRPPPGSTPTTVTPSMWAKI
jgi:hypothetical protein